MRKILITGSSGMVGRNLIEKLNSGVDDLITPSSEKLDLLNSSITAKFIKDVKPDLIIHCAGIVGGIQANIANPVKFLVDNTDMGRNLLLAARDSGVKDVLNLGSSCMYPRKAPNPLKEKYVLDGELEPTNEGYAIAKIYTARLAQYIHSESSEFNYKTIIPCNLYGKWDKFDPQHSHMIPAVIRKVHEAKLANAETIDIWGNGKARREFMYAEDLADFILFGINHFDKLPSLMNVGLGVDYTINEYYKTIKKVVGYQGDFVHDLSKPVGMKQKLVDVSLQNELGWVPKFSLDEGIKNTYNFFLENA